MQSFAQGLLSQWMELENLHSLWADIPEGYSQTGKEKPPQSSLRAASAMLRGASGQHLPVEHIAQSLVPDTRVHRGTCLPGH